MTIKLEKSRHSLAIQSLNKGSVLELMQSIVLPSQSFGATVQSTEYNMDKYEYGAMDTKNLLVSVIKWANNILSIDDFSRELSIKLLAMQDKDNAHVWDYNIEQYLEQLGYDTFPFIQRISDYTYNMSDNCRLDRNIHFTVFEYDSEDYVCFSVHHGADARVGFSDTIVLKIEDFDYFFDSMTISAYNSVTDEDVNIWSLEDVAKYDCGNWYTKDTDQLIHLHSSAEGY